MLTADDMMPMFLGACPSYRERWAAYTKDGYYCLELHYAHLADFARHLLDLMDRGCTEELVAAILAVERLQQEGDEYVFNAIGAGLLEGIWFVGGNEGRRPQRFVDLLGPQARVCWAEAAGW